MTTATLFTSPTIVDALVQVPLIDPDTQLGVYVHVPFCQKHCPYCDFAVVTGLLHRAPDYVEALCAEIRAGAAAYTPNPPIATVFLGGGTPSLLPAAQVGRILDALRGSFTLRPDAEVTLEANPGPLRPRHLAGFRAVGVTRLSLGMQTFNPRGLAALGRLHTPEDGHTAVANARIAGFAGVSLDLIFGWEGQTLTDWRDDLDVAIALRPDHLSVYSLTVEEGTPLAHAVAGGATTLPDDDAGADMFLLADELLTAAGYTHYEVSNYALPGHRSRHNGTYWQNGDYLGFGVGAHSHRRDRRWWNTRDFHGYMNATNSTDGTATGEVEAGAELLSPATAMGETMLLGLRLREGVNMAAFAARHGRDLTDVYGSLIAENVAQGLVAVVDGRVALTERGRPLADAVAAQFVAAAED